MTEYNIKEQEIIETQNIINELEKLRKNYYVSRKRKENLIKKNNINNIFTSVSAILSIFIWGTLANKIDFTMNSVKFGYFFTVCCAAVAGSFIVFSTTYNQYKNDSIRKDIRGLKLSLKNLEKELNLKHQYLNELKNNPTVNNTYKKNTKDELIELKRKLLLYYKIGKNEDQYFKYYKEGTLDKKLTNSDEIETAKTYFKSKKSQRKTTI